MSELNTTNEQRQEDPVAQCCCCLQNEDPNDATTEQKNEDPDFWEEKAGQRWKDSQLPMRIRIWMVLHACAVVIFLYRAIAVFVRESRFWKAAARVGFAVLYAVLGILLPWWSHRLTKSKEYLCLVEYHRKACLAHGGDTSRFLDIFNMIRRAREPLTVVFNAMSCISPLRSLVIDVLISFWGTIFLPAKDVGRNSCLVASLIGVIGMMVFSSTGVCEEAVEASVLAVRNLIIQIKDEDNSFEYLWLRSHYVRKSLERVWANHSVGGIWTIRTSVLFTVSLCLWAYSLSIHKVDMFVVFVVGAMLSSSFGIFLIFQMAWITNSCGNNRPGAYSVVAAVQDRMRRHMINHDGERNGNGFRDLRKYAFADYIMKSDMGIHLLGVRVTYTLVLQLMRQILLYIPIMSTMLRLFSKRLEAERTP